MSVTGFNRRRRELAELGKAKQGNTEGQEAQKEPTWQELRQQAKEAGIEGYGKMKKAGLLAALRSEA